MATAVEKMLKASCSRCRSCAGLGVWVGGVGQDRLARMNDGAFSEIYDYGSPYEHDENLEALGRGKI